MRRKVFSAAVVSLAVGAGSILFACSGGGTAVDAESVGQDNSQVNAAKNFCVGQAAATFHCIDDTNFEECIGGDKFVIQACPKGLCATRNPPNQDPCVGAARAAQIDGVPPPPTGTGRPGTGNPGSSTGGGTTSGGNGRCVGGPKFDPAGAKNVGNGVGDQFIGGQCLGAKDCASGCCALPCGICSGPGAQFQAGKMGCGFGG